MTRSRVQQEVLEVAKVVHANASHVTYETTYAIFAIANFMFY
jgi:hypothetical protein